MAWGSDSLGLQKVCPICGKNFVAELQHIYRDKSNPSHPLVCTYPCMRESERRAEEKRENRVKRYRRLDPADMTEQQKRERLHRTVTCEGCDHAKVRDCGGKALVVCDHPDREYIEQHEKYRRGYNQIRVIAVIRDEPETLKTPVWCPRKKEILEQWDQVKKEVEET